MFKKKTSIRINAKTGYGDACLESICRFYNQYIPPILTKDETFPGKRNLDVKQLAEAAEKLGFSATPVRAIGEALHIAHKPMIANMISKNNEYRYTVLYKVNNKHILLMDPTDRKLHKVKYDDFMASWTSILILIEYPHQKKLLKTFFSNISSFLNL